MGDAAPQQAWADRWGWLVIGAAVLLTYWPLSSFQWAVAHGDTLNCWLPWRWFISSCLQDGRFPLWNAHQQFGYPMHADLQGPAWYVEAIALGGTVGHGIRVLQALYLVYLMIGGCGMMRLSRNIHGDARVGLIIGTAYALGGFLTGHQQHFYAIISAAWLPWLIDAFLQLLREPGWRPAARVALLQGLLLTGGNHTFTIISAYLLLALATHAAYRALRAAGSVGLVPLIRYGSFALIGAALIAAGPLHAWWETSGLLSRGSMTYGSASVGAVTAPSLISLLYPFATGTDMERLGTDPPMANAYMGALVMAFALIGLVRRRSALENTLLLFGVICAFAAFGDATPVHHWLWRWMPGMDLFRFPAYFRWFTWIAVLVLAGGTFRAWLSGELDRRWVIGAIAFMSLIALITMLIYLDRTASLTESSSLFGRIRSLPPAARALAAACVSLPVLLVAALLCWQRRLGFGVMLILVVLDMGWNSSLALWNTAVSDIEPAWIERRLEALSSSPLIPRPVPTRAYDDNGARLHYLAHNTHDFLGGFSRNGVNSFWLRNAMELEVSHPSLWNAMSHQPVAYLADSITGWERYDHDAVNSERDSGLVVLMPGGHRGRAEPRQPGDACEVTAFTGDAFTITSVTASAGMLVLQQSSYPGWEASIDGAPTVIVPVNIAAMAVQVPAGKHKVVFRYRKPIAPWLLTISLTTLFGLMLALSLNTRHIGPLIGSTVLLAMTMWSLFAHGHDEPRAEQLMNRAVHQLPDNASVILNDDGSSPMPTTGDMVGWRIRADMPQDAGRAWHLLQAAARHRTERAPSSDRELHWFDAALRADPAVRAMILDQYDVERMDALDDGDHLKLVQRPSPAGWHMFGTSRPTGPRWLDAQQPFGSGINVSLDSLAAFLDGELVVDLWTSSPRPAQAVIVIERRSGEHVTDYRALPIRIDGPSETPCYSRQPIDELYRSGEELRIYLWSNEGDSVQERGFRVRAARQRFNRW